MAKSKQERWDDVHKASLTEFDEIQSACRETREQCLEDRRFASIPGAQWEGSLGDQFENQPRFEFNRIHLAGLRVVNEYRNNRITVDFVSRDGQQDDTMADTCDGLYRADEQACNADEAKDTAFEEAVYGGIGAFRFRACYEDDYDDENTKQRIELEPIHDADSRVFFDLGCVRADKSDAKRCYVLVPYTPAAYKEEFGSDPSTWSKDITQAQFDWNTPDRVWVCELYRVEERSEMVYWYRSRLGGVLGYKAKERRVTETEIAADEALLETLAATGFELVREKRVKARVIRKYVLSAEGVLLEEEIPGQHIPVVMTFGPRRVIDGVERCMGIVRLAKDAQRLTNMLMSWLAEIAARFDVEKPIFTPDQVAGHAQRWADSVIKRYPYELINPLLGQDGTPLPPAPLAYTKAPMVPPAMAALLQIATEALNDLLGAQQAGEQMQPNLSGKAVELIQQRLDMQTFIYVDNFKSAVRRGGEIWLSMKSAVTVETSRRMKTLAADYTAGSVVVNEPKVNGDGEEYLENDLTKATFDVVASVGPSSSSRRAATVRALSGLASISDDQEVRQALIFATIANLEGEGLDDLREWGRRKSIALGIVKPTEEEAAELAQQKADQQPDAQTQFLQASALEATARAQKAQADAVLAAAKTEEAQANAVATLAGIDTDQQRQTLDTIKAIHEVTKTEAPSAQQG